MIYFALKIAILVILVLIFLGLIWQFIQVVFLKKAPFFLTGRKVFNAIIAELKNESFDQIVELGCADASFLRLLSKKYPQAKCSGVENLWGAYFLARIFCAQYKNIKIFHKNIEKFDLHQADLIYCFLNVVTMKKLEAKFKNECRPGTKIISYNFPLPSIEPYKIIRVDAKAVFFYQI